MDRTLVLFEDDGFVDLLPLVFWRSVFELRVGRKILLDQAAQALGLSVGGVWTRDWLSRVAAQRCGAPANHPVDGRTVLVNGRWMSDGPVEFPKGPCAGIIDGHVAFLVCDTKLAKRLKPSTLLQEERRQDVLEGIPQEQAEGRVIRYPWDIIGNLHRLLESDWRPVDAAIETEVDTRLTLENSDRIHIGERTQIHPTAVLNATEGSIYISHDVRIGAYAVIEGPAYIGPGSHIHPSTWLHGGNAIGPVCKVAGELCGCVLSGYANKQHAGYLGHAYVGSWANIGAGATNSDLKNTYGRIRVPVNGVEVDTGQQFFGAILGDHAKIGINGTIPTGAVIGLAATISATRMLPKYIPSFSWVTEERVGAGDPLRMLDAASAAMARRNVDMTDDEVELFIDLGTRVRTFEAAARS